MTSRTMSKGGGGACECLHPPPPLQEILYPRLDRDTPKSFTLFRPLHVHVYIYMYCMSKSLTIRADLIGNQFSDSSKKLFKKESNIML